MNKKVYFNDPQRLTQLIGARTTVIVAGRRTGKTDSIAAPFVLRNMQRMAGSTGGIVVPTFKHGFTNTIPGLLAAWRRWGWMEGVHFVVGRRPPKHFLSPITPPKDYENVISFCNGSIAIVLSQDRPGAANSLTLSWLLVDEARFIDYNKLKNETLPANGGIKSFFGRHGSNHSLMILSDMPQTSRGSWFLHYRDKMDPELIELIKGTVYEIWRFKKKIRADRERGIMPSDTQRYALRELDSRLNQMRSQAVYYKEYSSVENLQLLGEDYIRQMKRDLTPLTFQTSIMCQRVGIAKDGFYSSMKEGHKYFAENNDLRAESAMHGDYISSRDCSLDTDLNPDRPICIGMDYNANINCLVAGQPDYQSRRLNILKSFFVKFERKLPELIRDFCEYYAPHPCKEVVFYHDSTALGSNYAVNDQDFRWVVQHEFEKAGWIFTEVYLGSPMAHHEKYLLINQAFAGRQRLMPYFNQANNEDLVIAVQAAKVERGRNGFRKDKSGEKLAETEENLLEHRTDITDAFDTLFIGCEKRPMLSDYRMAPAIV